MGYHTDFFGYFQLNRPLAIEHREYLNKFNQTRRMRRSVSVCNNLPDPARVAVKLPVGEHGAYFVGATGYMGQDNDESVSDYNLPPVGQPGLWCQWVPNKDGTAIEWDGGEKFYCYVEWIQYLITHFLQPWGYKLSGDVQWDGEDFGDTGTISIVNNDVFVNYHVNQLVQG